MYSKLLTVLAAFFFIGLMAERSYLRAYLVERPTAPDPDQGRVIEYYKVDRSFHYLSAEEVVYAKRIGLLDDALFCCAAGTAALVLRNRMKAKPGSVMIFGKPSL